jgi:hypothetical protein
LLPIKTTYFTISERDVCKLHWHLGHQTFWCMSRQEGNVHLWTWLRFTQLWDWEPRLLLWDKQPSKTLKAKYEKTCYDNQHHFIPYVFDIFDFITPNVVNLLHKLKYLLINIRETCCLFVFHSQPPLNLNMYPSEKLEVKRLHKELNFLSITKSYNNNNFLFQIKII